MCEAHGALISGADRDSISRAGAILRRGGLVAFPTETVYGLGADAGNDRAVVRIFEAKGRPRFNPLIVHVRDFEHARSLANFVAPAKTLAEMFWPGPLSLVLLRRADARISLLASAGLDTIALRVPAHPVAQQLLDDSRLAIAAPSANASGTISPTSAAHVAESLGEAVDLILDAGFTPFGIESTVIGFNERGPLLLRPGALPREEIENLIGPLLEPAGHIITSPGRLTSHYAPRVPLRLDAREVGSDDALLAFGSDVPPGARATRNLSVSGDLREAAANLFAMLRELDATGCASIAVMSVPEHGLGEAINDRLRRAAAPRNS
ncbi:MAG TPA: L-threonylcarbamoyladenylate synthase [Rhizomicrobium sp.]|jgi:L-threonylcarbamoyladenylate synthase|nr:L-threonylcarbamoyladenylate synthase [Rhizomicrobium sp.]